MTAASLEEASDGRFTLGLRTSTATAIEGLHGTAFDRPVRRAHETIELIREFTAGTGEPVDYEGNCSRQRISRRSRHRCRSITPASVRRIAASSAGSPTAGSRTTSLFDPRRGPSRRSRTPPGTRPRARRDHDRAVRPVGGQRRSERGSGHPQPTHRLLRRERRGLPPGGRDEVLRGGRPNRRRLGAAATTGRRERGDGRDDRRSRGCRDARRGARPTPDARR